MFDSEQPVESSVQTVMDRLILLGLVVVAVVMIILVVVGAG
jgi:hypothetical protein